MDGPTLKDRFTALDTLALVREIRALTRARVDKAFDLPGGGWSLVLRVPNEGRWELRLFPGRYAALAREIGEHGEDLTPMAKDLRRLLSGAIVTGARDPKSERYLELELLRGGASQLVLGLEFFGSGNLVVAEGGTIVAVAKPRAWAHRVVRIGAEYQRPPERTDPWSMETEQLAEELRRSHSDLPSTLAARLALGGPAAEEILARAHVTTASSPVEIAGMLRTTISQLRSEIADPPRGYVYERDREVVDATPYPSRRWTDDPSVRETELPRFSDAALRYFPALLPAGPALPKSPEEIERGNLERQRERQIEAVRSLEESARRLVAQGQAILTHFEEVERQLADIRSRPDPPASASISLDGQTVSVLVDQPPRASAQALFDEAKRAQAKLAGARAALAASEARLAHPVAPPRRARTSVGGETHGPEFWFERFRWFVSSDRLIVVAGRDAGSNDRVVRRHLRDGDIYLHADLHGASSVVVKSAGPGQGPIPERTIDEAGRWAVAFSKAWRAGLASATAFWVTADQVSKTPATGEFVARGSWVVTGTKHYLKDLPLELALGTLRYEGQERWTVAPESAVRLLGTARFLLTPGDERERAEREVELSRETGVSRSRLQGLLPAGGLTFRRA